MRELKNKLTSGKNTKNIQIRKGKTMFGYNVLGFGSGGGSKTLDVDYLVLGAGGGGAPWPGGGGGAGGFRTSYPGGTK